MKTMFCWAIVVVLGLLAISGRAYSSDVKLSPQVLDLLRAEMREVSAGMQAMAFSIASGDWRAIRDTSARIRASYIMEKKLTPAQARELENCSAAALQGAGCGIS